MTFTPPLGAIVILVLLLSAIALIVARRIGRSRQRNPQILGDYTREGQLGGYQREPEIVMISRQTRLPGLDDRVNEPTRQASSQ